MIHSPLDYEVCIHEAGHAVAACLRGIDFHRVQVDFDLDTEQTTGQLSQGRGVPTDTWVSIAGPAALAFYRGEAEGLGFRGIESSPGARGDIHAIFRAWYGCGGGVAYYDGVFARRTERLFRGTITKIIAPHFPGILATAARVREQQALSAAEVRAIVRGFGHRR